ncbi:formylglycine-generating enzyme family protein [Ferrovum myxofaciens]|uniref:Formylglycine-generating enzyme family protein n=1 Tax=Ferrovum myxofaciens TaxID=416213 RepID=A0A9E6SWZ6_9PROT|nr:formylglycine-generating enzyme family protein [Ferrovum myxofaciens]QKE39746.2 MAG: formylglycine-generating enzyme family protein [Ferrovum myxofaciens]QWY73632.1 MAG: formylglycine-generating enzyme family protein [Ferrovum myxofaciens]QWY76386.1 MAG: formylglycine-generating enzyme family protein [Ferrovum myxofaciens]
MALSPKTPSTPEERLKRKKILSATLVTCIGIVMIGSSLHVIKLGQGRMEDMRNLVSYNIKDSDSHIRAAGEDIQIHAQHESGQVKGGYTVEEADRLLTREQWEDLNAMVTIPAGPFRMGTNLDRADPPDKPEHTVDLPAYAIDKYPVTNAQYARFVAATGHRPPLNWKGGKIPQGALLLPVTLVTWYDAKAYAQWAHKRLPTEAEFEKAGRGKDGRRWPWGNIMDPTKLNTYYNRNSSTPVTDYPQGASSYGIFDLSGNVDEWTDSDFAPYPGSIAPTIVFQGKVSVQESSQDRNLGISDQKLIKRSYKVLRGGSWKSDPFSTSLFHRDNAFANMTSDFYGFRCASSLPSSH